MLLRVGLPVFLSLDEASSDPVVFGCSIFGNSLVVVSRRVVVTRPRAPSLSLPP